MKFSPTGSTVKLSAGTPGTSVSFPSVDATSGVLRVYSRKSTLGDTTLKFGATQSSADDGFPIRDGQEYFIIPPPGATQLIAWGSSDVFITAGQFR